MLDLKLIHSYHQQQGTCDSLSNVKYITLNGQKNLPPNGIHYRQLHHYVEGIARKAPVHYCIHFIPIATGSKAESKLLIINL